MSRIALCTLLAAIFAFAGSSRGQITSAATGNAGSTSGTIGYTTVFQENNAIDASAGNTLKLKMSGDWSYTLARGVQTFNNVDYAYLPFTVGPLPVKITNFNFTYNAKWVNGGGNSTVPATSINVLGGVRERAGAAVDINNDIIIVGTGFLDSLNGNGLKVETSSPPSPFSDILAPGVTYYLFVKDNTTTDTTGFNNNTPTIGVANEYGGSLSTGTFDPFVVSVDWQTVPEPTSATIMCMFAGLLLCRRRR